LKKISLKPEAKKALYLGILCFASYFAVYIVRNNTSIEGTYQIIKDLGLLTHTDSKADILINNMKKDLEN